MLAAIERAGLVEVGGPAMITLAVIVSLIGLAAVIGWLLLKIVGTGAFLD